VRKFVIDDGNDDGNGARSTTWNKISAALFFV